MGKFIDLAGKTFGKWNVISQDGWTDMGNAKWLCVCRCGEGRTVVSGSLMNGGSSGCGHCYHINEIGNVYGRLTVMSEERKDKWGNVFWSCNCECGGNKTINGASLRKGITQSCGCLGKERRLLSRELPYGKAAINKAIVGMKHGARKRKLQWNLTNEQVINMMNQNCYYCSSSPTNLVKSFMKNKGDCVYSGIDRLNSSIGYILENVVSCCIICNKAKLQMSKDVFLAWIEQVYNHSIKKGMTVRPHPLVCGED